MEDLKEKMKNFFYKNKYTTLMVIIGLIIVLLDMLTKTLTDGKSVTIIQGFLSFISSHNTGAAWSILNEHTWLLILVSIIFIVIIIIANYYLKQKNYFNSISVGLILSGAVCNLYDRIFYGYVRDFISLDFINFPIFNIADCAITIGVIMLCIYLLLLTFKEKSEFNDQKIIEENSIETERNNNTKKSNEVIKDDDICEVPSENSIEKKFTNEMKDTQTIKFNKRNVKSSKSTSKKSSKGSK